MGTRTVAALLPQPEKSPSLNLTVTIFLGHCSTPSPPLITVFVSFAHSNRAPSFSENFRVHHKLFRPFFLGRIVFFSPFPILLFPSALLFPSFGFSGSRFESFPKHARNMEKNDAPSPTE
ncbi:hypothetical protein AKJ16_DCAP16881 [Drosera capensis]